MPDIELVRAWWHEISLGSAAVLIIVLHEMGRWYGKREVEHFAEDIRRLELTLLNVRRDRNRWRSALLIMLGNNRELVDTTLKYVRETSEALLPGDKGDSDDEASMDA